MSYTQLVQPDLTVKALPGWCLWFDEEVNKAPHLYRSSWEAGENTQYKHLERTMPNVSVPVWFSHYGTYGTPPTYGNWGHVVQWVPDRNAFLSVIGSGTVPGQKWFDTLEQIEKYFTAKYVYWSEDIATKRIVEENDVITSTEENYQIWARAMLVGRGQDLTREDFNKEFVGKPELEMVQACTQGPESEQQLDYVAWGHAAKDAKPSWNVQIANLTEESGKKDKKIGELEKEIADGGDYIPVAEVDGKATLFVPKPK